MVRTKTPPHHADVRPPKCIVYISRNPVTFEIHRRRELYLLDQKAREKRQQEDYKRHVHAPPAQCTATIAPKNTVNYRRYEIAAVYCWRRQLSREYRNINQL